MVEVITSAMDKVLTIVIPTYNMEKYLRKCLDSLIIDNRELFGTLEVLVVIDGAKDSSSAIAHEYQEKAPAVFRVIDKENGNYGSCVNRGLKEATGKYIKILDADDTFDTCNFGEFLSFLKTQDVDCVISDMMQVGEEGECKSLCRFNLPQSSIFSLDEMGEKEWRRLWMHCVCYKTENLRKINYHQTEGISYTDQEWICLPMATSKRLSYFPHVVYKYLVGRAGQTISVDVWERNLWQEIEGLKTMINSHRSIADKYSLNTTYVDSRISTRAFAIYFAYFFKFKTNKNHDLVVSLDRFIKENSPVCYQQTQYVTIKKYFKFPIIKIWRKNYQDKSLLIIIYKGIYKILNNLVIFLKLFI